MTEQNKPMGPGAHANPREAASEGPSAEAPISAVPAAGRRFTRVRATGALALHPAASATLTTTVPPITAPAAPDAASSAPDVASSPDLTAHPFQFKGQGPEFFKIWIVNLALTLFTFGLYSAWAKVRTNRYFYGNTEVAGATFDYHATGMQILIGRLIALVVIGIYFGSAIVPAVNLAVIFLLILATPWAIVRALRFQARNSSYRTVRFDFKGQYGEAFKAYVALPILGALSLFLLYPYAMRAQQRFVAGNLTWGGAPVAATLSLGQFYRILAAGVGSFLVAFFVLTTPWVGLIMGLALDVEAILTEGQSWKQMALITLFNVPGILAFVIASVIISTMTTNAVFNALVFDGQHRFQSTLRASRVVWITITNALMVIVSVGLLLPYARIRLARYRASQTAFLAATPLDTYVDQERERTSAIGDELGEVFDLEIGL